MLAEVDRDQLARATSMELNAASHTVVEALGPGVHAHRIGDRVDRTRKSAASARLTLMQRNCFAVSGEWAAAWP